MAFGREIEGMGSFVPSDSGLLIPARVRADRLEIARIHPEMDDPRTQAHRELWRDPAALIARRKAELHARGEPIVELLDSSEFSLYLQRPLPLNEEQIRALGYQNMEGSLKLVVEQEADFTIVGFGDKTTGEEHIAVIKGIGDGENVPIRVHSSCITAESFHAANCDCQEQLERALLEAHDRGLGGVLWLHQEGRGNGLEAKIKQLQLMYREGLHTVEAYETLGYPSEIRDFTAAADMLKILGIKSIEMITNNPDKIAQMQASGIRVTGVIPCYAPPRNERIGKDLAAKRDHHNHRIPDEVNVRTFPSVTA